MFENSNKLSSISKLVHFNDLLINLDFNKLDKPRLDLILVFENIILFLALNREDMESSIFTPDMSSYIT